MRLVSSAILIAIVLFVFSSHADESRPFSVTGERIVVGVDGELIFNAPMDHTSDEKSVEDTTNPFVTVSRSDRGDDGAIRVSPVTSGFFKDGKVEFEGTIDDRTEILITVYGSYAQPIELDAIAIPGETLSFVLLEYQDQDYPNRLLLVGESRINEELDSKFTVSGDLNSISNHGMPMAIAEITLRTYLGPKIGIYTTRTAVLLHEGSFLIEGRVTEPLVVSLLLSTPNNETVGFIRAIVEPGEHIQISSLGYLSLPDDEHKNWSLNLAANSESKNSMHTKVIESWQDSPEYLEKLKEFNNAIENQPENRHWESEVQSAIAESTDQASPTSGEIFREMVQIRLSVLESLVQNLDDPMVALLALEFGSPYGNSLQPYSFQLDAWDKIADLLDVDLVNRRVSWRRTLVAQEMRKETNAQTVFEGQKAPQFTLSNLEGEEILLSNVLAESEVVLVNFWASWCIPCVAAIPKLKKLHSDYADDGFEIVFLSIDDSIGEWESESMRQQLPWINVRDLYGWHSSSVVHYGVQWLPTEFAINSDGEILDRGLTTGELEEFLANHFEHKLNRESSDLSVPTVASTE
ncbi:MAG: TlpA disulfide reductase family protein [Gammaproteobacteria bacterium]|nr:TlpA disulfide reductase family protein [Gammaproteobacteria bacterium]